MAFALRCPSCRKRFKWDLQEKGMPQDCPLCGERVASDRDDSDIVMPFVRSPKTDNIDKLYRDIEKGSETRMNLAAEMTGAPVSEMAGLKITDMKDNLKPGDISVPDAPNIGQHFVSNGAEHMSGIASGAVAVNGQVTNGIAPRAGASAVQGIRNVMGQGAWNVATVNK